MNIYTILIIILAKALLIFFTIRNAHRRKTKVVAIMYGLIFTPLIANFFFLLHIMFNTYLSDIEYWAFTLFCFPADIGILSWIRVIFDPQHATKDIKYRPSITY